ILQVRRADVRVEQEAHSGISRFDLRRWRFHSRERSSPSTSSHQLPAARFSPSSASASHGDPTRATLTITFLPSGRSVSTSRSIAFPRIFPLYVLIACARLHNLAPTNTHNARHILIVSSHVCQGKNIHRIPDFSRQTVQGIIYTYSLPTFATYVN